MIVKDSLSWQAARDEWRKNARLRMGVWLVLGILAIYGVLWLNDQIAPLQQDYRRLHRQLARLEQLKVQRHWPESAERAALLRQQMESRLWQASSPGLAQANLYGWLHEHLKKIAIDQALIQVEEAAEILPEQAVWQVSAQLTGRFEASSLLKLLRAVEADERLTVIEQLDVRQEPVPRFTLIIKTYFKIAP